MFNRMFNAKGDDDSRELLSVYSVLNTHLTAFLTLFHVIFTNSVHCYYIPILQMRKIISWEICKSGSEGWSNFSKIIQLLGVKTTIWSEVCSLLVFFSIEVKLVYSIILASSVPHSHSIFACATVSPVTTVTVQLTPFTLFAPLNTLPLWKNTNLFSKSMGFILVVHLFGF